MDKENKKAVLEAILFAMGDSIELSKLAETIEEDADTTKALLDELSKKYESEESGITLLKLEDSYQLATKPFAYDYLIKLAKAPRKIALSESIIETLSIIAYKQPITRLEIESIRGVSSDYAVNKLLEYELIEELGRKDAPGKPLLFGTTEEFLRCFGVSSLKELPEIDTLHVEEFKAEAEEEVNQTLKI